MLNLAVKLAPSFGVKDGRASGLSSETKKGARDGKAAIVNQNAGVTEARLDPALRARHTSQLYPVRYGNR